jgi:hypothetical protein
LLIWVGAGQIKAPPRLPLLFWPFYALGIAVCLLLVAALLSLVSGPFALIVGLLFLLLAALAQFTGFVVLAWTSADDGT